MAPEGFAARNASHPLGNPWVKIPKSFMAPEGFEPPTPGLLRQSFSLREIRKNIFRRKSPVL